MLIINIIGHGKTKSIYKETKTAKTESTLQTTGNTTDSSEADRYKEYVVGRKLPDGFGEDTDVLHIKLEDFYQGWEENAEYSCNYLLECRKQLVGKVESYRRKIEELCTDKTETALKHRKEIDDIQTFYHNIAFGTSRSGAIVKKAMSTSGAANACISSPM